MKAFTSLIFGITLTACVINPLKADIGELKAKAEAGDSTAMFAVALSYDSGKGVPRDLKEAAKWYLLSAEAGFPEAQNSIASMYQAGDGLEKDLGKALMWYQKAADQGHLEAIHNLAFLYDEGMGVAEDNKKAIELYTRAAEKGFVKSMLNLGIMYSQGDGIPTNNIEAYKWLDLARFYTQNSRDMRLKWGVRSQLDALKKKMSSVDIAAAEKLTREWDETYRKR